MARKRAASADAEPCPRGDCRRRLGSVTEAGGPATQSGIFFQNTIAARYLGRLCDPTERLAKDDVVGVRVEAPEHVDDIVVTYRDAHRDWISAKERLDPSSEEFAAVWSAFARQSGTEGFGASDRLVLVVGTLHGVHEAILDLASRAATSSSTEEWQARCGKKHAAALEKIQEALPDVDRNELWRLLSRVHVEIISLDLVERNLADWMPSSSVAKHTLVRLLRDRVGGHARVRREFSGVTLTHELHEVDSVEFVGPGSAEATYAAALLRRYAQLIVPGTSIGGSAEAIYTEPLLRILPAQISARSGATTAFHDQEIYEREGPRVGLEAFEGENGAVVVAPAGFGKTELVRTLARRFIRDGLVPAVVPLVDADERALPLLGYLEVAINGALACDVDWAKIAEQGRAVLLLDGLDELADHPRALALKRLNDFLSRFPRAKWIVTVREEAALLGIPDATMLALEPWHDERRLQLVRRFMGAEHAGRAEALCTRLSQSSELDRLARVPLFLALLVEESKSECFEPTTLRRRDLLLRYVERLISAECDAEKRPTTNSRRQLVDAAERIALLMLKAGSAELGEDACLSALEESPAKASETLLSDLASSGLLRVSRRRVRFVFPLVQEYLAGRRLQRTTSSRDLTDLFRAAATRPWAQALRFALEETVEADAVARELLSSPDDAFYSVTLALGQCVADGARIEPTTRMALAERLGRLWAESGFGEHLTLTRILAAGFSSPLPRTAREALEGSRRLDQGGGVLLSAACDDALSRAVLRRRPIPFGYKLGDAKAAMSRIADDVVATCVEWVQSTSDRAKTFSDAGWVGCIVRDLDNVSRHVRRGVQNDSTLPHALRIGALLLEDGDLGSEHKALVEAALREVLNDKHPSRTYHFELIEEAIWRFPPALAEELWAKWVRDESYLPRWRALLLSGMVRYRTGEQAMSLLKRLQPPPSLIDSTKVITAWLGRREAMVDLTDRVDELDEHALRGWSCLVGRYLESDLIMRGIRRLVGGRRAPGEYHDIAHKVWFPLVHDVDAKDPLNGPHGRYRRLHPAAAESSVLFYRWGLSADDSEGAKTLCLTIAADLGNEEARDALLHQVMAASRARPKWFKQDYALSHAVVVLSRTEALPITLLESLARSTESMDASNLLNSVYSACAKRPSREALEFLLREVGRLRTHLRPQARGALGIVSQALGVRIEERATKLVVA